MNVFSPGQGDLGTNFRVFLSRFLSFVVVAVVVVVVVIARRVRIRILRGPRLGAQTEGGPRANRRIGRLVCCGETIKLECLNTVAHPCARVTLTRWRAQKKHDMATCDKRREQAKANKKRNDDNREPDIPPDGNLRGR
jgi:hypothetical protein